MLKEEKDFTIEDVKTLYQLALEHVNMLNAALKSTLNKLDEANARIKELEEKLTNG